ncbi:hypothetical protein FACS189419_07270 [Planctomycetales bacterium]|nr:hypothetical protein FACS189419_07270 [Planctomycetales bacterium]
MSNWFYANAAGQQVGPVSEEEIQNAIQNNLLRGDTPVWRDGMPQWSPLGSTELAASLPGGYQLPAYFPSVNEPDTDIGFFDVLLKKYCQFRGRARRKEFWMFFLWQFIIALVSALILTSTLIAAGIDEKTNDRIMDIYQNILQLAFFLPNLAVGARRMHDIGKSGWWYGGVLLFSICCCMTQLLLIKWMSSLDWVWILLLSLVVSGILVAVNIMLFLWCIRNSQPGPNQYGHNPKGL